MTDSEIANHTYDLLKRVAANGEATRFDIEDIKLRMSAFEDHMRGVVTSVAGLNARMDRFDERLRRMERRLDLRGTED